MKAIRLHSPVGAEGLTYEDVPDAVPSIGDVLVKVHACGITPSELDWPIWTDPLARTASTPLVVTVKYEPPARCQSRA